jgi:hypothetical protein
MQKPDSGGELLRSDRRKTKHGAQSQIDPGEQGGAPPRSAVATGSRDEPRAPRTAQRPRETEQEFPP